jgi:transcriptional regulator with XRE-family HTH domain/Zn-dependent peptidase ImmA (M78 family)
MPNSINERIKNRRKELHLSQAELANQIGLKPPAISQYESGARRPSFEIIQKLAFALKVTTEYLISGVDQVKAQHSINLSDRLFLNIVNSLSPQDKEKLVEYAAFLATGRKIKMDILYETPKEYAEAILTEKVEEPLPIDLYKLANELGIKVLEDDLEEAEGIYIQSEFPIILLARRKKHEHRARFTLATLIAHHVLPWHLKNKYFSRKYRNNQDKNQQFGVSSLLTQEIEEMEAHQFASTLLIPTNHLTMEFTNKVVNIETVQHFAEKYHVTLFMFLNRLVDFAPEKYAVVQSDGSNIMKRFQGNRALVSKLHTNSIAASFFHKPSTQIELRRNEVPASYWFIDSKMNETVIEESVYNPDMGRVLSLITILEEK